MLWTRVQKYHPKLFVIPDSALFLLIVFLERPKFLTALSTGSFESLNEITFQAYTDLTNPNSFNVIKTGDVNSVQNSGLQPAKKVTVIAHVFLEDILISRSPSQQLKNAYLAAGYGNVIIANWRRKSNGSISIPSALLMYSSVVINDAPKVGRILAEFIAFLVNQGGIVSTADSVHVLGLSLGAHIAGSAGRHLQNSFSMKLGRITGLDPPGTLFYFISDDEKLGPNDASFVDILHTDIVLLGTRERLGHLDFYSNGGRRENQPGCRSGVTFPKYTDFIFCGHTSSVTIYIESLTKQLNACKCSERPFGIPLDFPVCRAPKIGQCTLPTTFGENGLTGARGSYYLKT